METNAQIFLIVAASIGAGCGIGAFWTVFNFRKELDSALAFLDGHVDIQASDIKKLQNQVLHLFNRIESLEKAAHGLKKDGTPRAKPGRKAVEL